MIRNIAGIMADEEPKTPISPSDLYNTSDFNSLLSEGDLSDVSLSGRSEFTFMCWVYLNTSSTVIPYIEQNSYPLSFLSSSLRVAFVNSNGGTTLINHPMTHNQNEWHHWVVTGSVSNNRIRLYQDGILLASAVMTYANDVYSFAEIPEFNFNLSQMNIFNRELSEAEVLEHYVYDDDTMTSGVLGYDAMTPAQKSGLIYSSSYTNTISTAGNEFTDKSGNNITLSPQPSLTGEQIYVYTDANDLPNGGGVPVVYPINSANLNGTSQGFTSTPISEFTMTTSELSYGVWFKRKSSNLGTLIRNRTTGSFGSGPQGVVLESTGASLTNIGIETDQDVSFVSSNVGSISIDTWHFAVVTLSATSFRVYQDDGVSLINQVGHSFNSITPSKDMTVGHLNNDRWFEGEVSIPFLLDIELSLAQVQELFRSGVPKCWDDVSQIIKDNTIWEIDLYNRTGNTGNELVNNGSGIITTVNVGSTPFTGTGLSVECTN